MSSLSATPSASTTSLPALESGMSTPPASSSSFSSTPASPDLIHQIINLHDQGFEEDAISCLLETGMPFKPLCMTEAPKTRPQLAPAAELVEKRDKAANHSHQSAPADEGFDEDEEAPASPLFRRTNPRESWVPNARVSMNTVLRSGTSLAAPSGWIQVN